MGVTRVLLASIAFRTRTMPQTPVIRTGGRRPIKLAYFRRLGEEVPVRAPRVVYRTFLGDHWGPGIGSDLQPIDCTK